MVVRSVCKGNLGAEGKTIKLQKVPGTGNWLTPGTGGVHILYVDLAKKRKKKEEEIRVKPVLRGHLSVKKKMVLLDRRLLKICSIHMQFSMTEQEKCDLLIQVTA